MKEELGDFFEFLSQMETFSRNQNFQNEHFLYSLSSFQQFHFEKLKELASILKSSLSLTSAEILSQLYI